jgi:hypothetical protein
MTDTSFSGQVRARRSEDEGASQVARLA